MTDPESSNKKRRRDEFDDLDDHEPYDGFIDDDSEPHKFGTSVLPVANLPSSFDGVPQDGMEYLFTVRREEKQLPLVTRAPNPYTIKGSTYKEPLQVNKADPKVQGALPVEEWRKCFEQRFLNFRKNIQQPTINISLPSNVASSRRIPEMRERDKWWAFFRGDPHWDEVSNRPKKAGSSAKKQTIDYDEELPKNKGKMRAWVVYDERLSWDQADGELPTEEAQNGADSLAALPVDNVGNPQENADLSGSALTSSKDKGSAPADNALPTPRGSPSLPTTIHTQSTPGRPASREPTPELLNLLDQKVTFHLLKYFTQWIQAHFDPSFIAPPPVSSYHAQRGSNGKSFYDLTPTHARWMFALLSRLDAQLTSEEISVLRKLAREVMRVLKKEIAAKQNPPRTYDANSNMGEVACWMIVAAVTGVWGQKDLWMDVEEVLR